MPVYNRERQVAESVRSVLSQTFRDLELIVVDDGSGDATPQILAELAETDPRMRILSQPNSGRPAIARNRGLREATGEFVAFLDSDDSYQPERLQRCVDVFSTDDDLGVVFHDILVANDGRAPPRYRNLWSAGFPEKRGPSVRRRSADVFYLGEDYYVFMSLFFAAMHTDSVLIRRSVDVEEGLWFREDYITNEDTDLWLRLAAVTRVAYIDQPLSVYRLHANNISADRNRQLQDAIQLHRWNLTHRAARFDAKTTSKYRRRIARYHEELAYRVLLAGENSTAWKNYWEALVLSPGAGPLTGLAKSVLPWAWLRRILERGSDDVRPV